VQGTLIVLVSCALAHSQEVGDTVRAKQEIDLKVENQKVASAAAGDLLTVRKLNDKWLWVQTAEGKRGWVLREHVEVVATPASPAPQPAPNSAATKPKSGEDPWLKAIGVLSGQNIYTTYAYIGSIADGYGDSTYDAQHVQQLMAEIVGMTNVSRDSLEKVRATNIVDQDKAAIAEVISILDLLSQEAEALSRYVQSGSDQDLKAYDKARTAVWPKVKSMLDLK
jgi:hypothetical protein